MELQTEAHFSRGKLSHSIPSQAERFRSHRLVPTLQERRLEQVDLGLRVEGICFPNGDDCSSQGLELLNRRSANHVCRSSLWNKQDGSDGDLSVLNQPFVLFRDSLIKFCCVKHLIYSSLIISLEV